MNDINAYISGALTDRLNNLTGRLGTLEGQNLDVRITALRMDVDDINTYLSGALAELLVDTETRLVALEG